MCKPNVGLLNYLYHLISLEKYDGTNINQPSHGPLRLLICHKVMPPNNKLVYKHHEMPLTILFWVKSSKLKINGIFMGIINISK